MQLMQDVAERGLSLVPLGLEGKSDGPFLNEAKPYEEGKPGLFRVAVCKKNDVMYWLSAKNDDDKIGRLLGYPNCCIVNFTENWSKNQCFERYVDGPIETNISLRFLGARLISHLPCSPLCLRSIDIARNNLSKFSNEARSWLTEALSWPIEYSALHGLLILTTPVCKILTKCIYTPKEVKMKRFGSELWTDNGFKTFEAMESAHSVILSLLEDLDYETVLDLGCGNGRLLRLVSHNGNGQGVEADPVKARKAGVKHGDIFDHNDFKYDLVLISLNRIREKGAEIVEKIAKQAKYLIIYSYVPEEIGWKDFTLLRSRENQYCKAKLWAL